MPLSLPLRINLYSLVFALLVATVLTGLGGVFLHHQQAETAAIRAQVAAEELAHRATRLLDMEMRFADFLNFDEQCAAVIRKDPALRDAAVFDAEGRPLFHSKADAAHGRLGWPAPLRPAEVEAALGMDTPHGHVELRPIVRGKSQIQGFAAVRVDGDAVLRKTLQAVSWLIASALALFVVGLLIQQGLLWRAIGRPLAGLVRTADGIQPDAPARLAPPPQVHAQDDIGRLYGAFDRLVQRLLDARAELVAHNEQLEATVQERTAQLAEVNAELARDIERRKQLEAELRTRASTDVLTGLSNRSFIMPYLERRIEQSRRDGRPLGVMLMDFDGFKAINDRYGHAAGDEVLRVMATRMSQLSRASDVLARLGGDEFLFAFEGFETDAQVRQVGQRLMSAFDSPVPCGALQLRLGVSIGVALFPAQGHDLPSLLAAADAAMYAAKQRGGGLGLAGAAPEAAPAREPELSLPAL